MHDPTELLVPKATGALLAEEWSIDPYTPLPSFLEMKFIEDAARSGREALKVAYDVLMQKLSAVVPREATNEQHRAYKYAVALFSVLKRYHAEWRFLLMYLIERHCLRISSATLAESVYGGKRSILVNEEGNRKRIVPLDRKNATRLALLLTLGPYLKGKLELLLQSQSALGIDPMSLRPSHRRISEIILRLLRAATEASNLFCQWRFLLGQSFHFDLASLCLSMIVRRQTQQDQMEQTSKTAPSSSSPLLSPTIRTAVVAAASLALSVSWFTQMRVAWLEHEASRRLLDAENDLPPPPHRKVSMTQSTRQCPKCHQPWVDPVVAVPGDFFVYCRECLDPDVLASKKIVRLYEPNAG